MSETREKCERCRGTGRLVCGACNGTGVRLVVVRGGEEEEWDVCPECWGHKLLECPACHGTGSAGTEVPADRNVA